MRRLRGGHEFPKCDTVSAADRSSVQPPDSGGLSYKSRGPAKTIYLCAAIW
jgi:hypothetical protein